jgi:hypothetical protein
MHPAEMTIKAQKALFPCCGGGAFCSVSFEKVKVKVLQP